MVNFERPHDPLAVRGAQRRCRTGIIPHQHSMKLARPFLRKAISPQVTECWRNVRHFGQPLRKGTEIKPGAADEDRAVLVERSLVP